MQQIYGAAAFGRDLLRLVLPVHTPPGTLNAEDIEKKKHEFLDLAKEHDWARVREWLRAAPEFVNVQPSRRWAALHQAAEAGSDDVVRDLLRFGANPWAQTRDGKTPRSMATAKGDQPSRPLL